MKKNQAVYSAGRVFIQNFINFSSFLNLLIFSHSALALEIPQKLSTDPRISIVAYDPNNVVQINGTTFTATQIIFSDSESIQEVQNGDLGAWTSSINKNLPNMIFIKPTTDHSETNMTIVTNQHTYYFHLSAAQSNFINPVGFNNLDSPNIPNSSNSPNSCSNSDSSHFLNASASTYAIKFIYPEEQQKLLDQNLSLQNQQKQSQVSAFSNPRDYNWNYSFNGDKTLVPLHVFDDGKFTYFQLQPHQTIPAIFAITSPDGKEAVVNFRREDQASGTYIILTMVAPQWTLREGQDHVASIFNNAEISKLNPKNRF